MKPDPRYPYTYACDYIRGLAGYNKDGTKLSRADASSIMEGIAKAMGNDGYEGLARTLADYAKEHEDESAEKYVRQVDAWLEGEIGMTTPNPLRDALPPYFMVFDVESIGLHGEGFAVAWVVVNREGKRLDEGCMACDPADCAGTDKSRLWVSENVPPLGVTSPTKYHLRNTFWHEWRLWSDQGAVLVADCAWPVEANFLSACVKLNHAEREWRGPYPLHDLASVLLALGRDPLATNERLPDELPAHHPLMDARQSARQLVVALGARQ